LLEQFLGQQRLSHQEFDMLVRTRAYLRKIAQPLLAGKISEENVQEAFAQLYGETVRVRHIQCANLQEIAGAKRRLAAGESFAQVARELSRNTQSREVGGELPPFSRQTTGLPQSFKDAAFALKEGEISDPVSAEGEYHLIQMVQRIAPKVVKFEDVKESVRKDLEERLMMQAQKELLQQIAQQTLATIKIENPVLKKQFEAKLHQRDEMIRDRERLRKEMEKNRPVEEPTTEPTTRESK
jgi:parvulin-like peptidyl-prolyl isomerase